jgi:hypothetical protein
MKLQRSKISPRDSIACLLRLWRLYKANRINRRYTVFAIPTGILTLLFFALSLMGLSQKWDHLGVWLVGLLTGLFEGIFILTVVSKRMWPATSCIIDWQRLEVIAANAEKSDP